MGATARQLTKAVATTALVGEAATHALATSKRMHLAAEGEAIAATVRHVRERARTQPQAPSLHEEAEFGWPILARLWTAAAKATVGEALAAALVTVDEAAACVAAIQAAAARSAEDSGAVFVRLLRASP